MTMPAHPPIAERTIGNYVIAAGSSGPTPGGGSVSGVVGAMAAALGQMVANVSHKNAADPRFLAQADLLQGHIDALLRGAEADEAAYGGYIDATRLPKGTSEEKATRRTAIQDALRVAANAPLSIARTTAQMVEDLAPVVELGQDNIISDAEVAVILGEAATCAALVNVRANLPWLKDSSLIAELSEAIADTETRVRIAAEVARQALAARRA